VEGCRDDLLVGQNDEPVLLSVVLHDHQVPDRGVVLEDVNRLHKDRVSIRARHDKLVHPAVARTDVHDVRKFLAWFDCHDGQPLRHADLDEDGQ